MSDFWHKLGCCVVEKPQPKKKRKRIDRSMIGEPMNFVHLTHIGSGDMGASDGLPRVCTTVLDVMNQFSLLANVEGTFSSCNLSYTSTQSSSEVPTELWKFLHSSISSYTAL
uniref:CDC42 small effector protein 1 n=1 Tax=Xenopus tropicalis TaxID=8364 RepID=A0A803KFX3_XENTR